MMMVSSMYPVDAYSHVAGVLHVPGKGCSKLLFCGVSEEPALCFFHCVWLFITVAKTLGLILVQEWTAWASPHSLRQMLKGLIFHSVYYGERDADARKTVHRTQVRDPHPTRLEDSPKEAPSWFQRKTRI